MEGCNHIMAPKFSIVTPVYGRKEWIPFTLQSLRNQTLKDFEVIIVNDGGERVDDILSQFSDLDIHYYEHKQNLGLPSARNTALEHVIGEYIVFLDSDDILLPLSLEFRLWALKKYNAEIVYTRALQNIYERKENAYHLIHQQLYWPDLDFDRDRLLFTNQAPCNCIAFSKKSWEETGYWLDPKLNSGEDFDFWIALSRKHDFKQLSLIDAEDSYRTDGGQMTGVRNFSNDLPRIFKRWRNTAINYNFVKTNQNAVLVARGLNPADYQLD